MNKIIIKVAPELVTSLFTQGECSPAYEVIQGLPPGAKLSAIEYQRELACVWLCFETDDPAVAVSPSCVEAGPDRFELTVVLRHLKPRGYRRARRAGGE